MEIKFLNTMGRKKEVFKPLRDRKVGLYACGPTVYDYAHLGHFRAYVFVDTLVRLLREAGYDVMHVMNITDVGHLTDDADSGEDKIEKRAREKRMDAWELAEFYTKDFFDAMERLNVKRPDIVCKATDHIKEMERLVQKIIDNGYAYIISDGIYLDTSKLPDYGKLAGTDLKGLLPGARIGVNPEKKQPWDFALWKFTPPGEKRQMEWESEFFFKEGLEKAKEVAEKNPNVEVIEKDDGFLMLVKGFPGWHIECTAMSTKYLGEVFDIHTGGVDHIPVHHTNEIAQAEAAFGHDFVRYWLHNEFLTVEGEKMSKSKGNFITMHDILERGFDPLALRYLFLTAHYRSPMNFTWEALRNAENTLNRLRIMVQELEGAKDGLREEKIREYWEKFMSYVSDDLSTPQALTVVWDVLKSDELTNQEKYDLMMRFDRILGLGLDKIKKEEVPEEIRKMVEEREEARRRKDWETADKIREKIREKGWHIEDTEKGPKLIKVR